MALGLGLGIGLDRTQPSGVSYTPLALSYFARVYTNFGETLSSAQKSAWNTKFLYLISIGADQHLDMMSGASFTCCTSAYQARTSLFGNYQSTPSGGWTNANWSNGIGWTQDSGSGYLSWNYNPYYGTYYTLDNAGIYQKVKDLVINGVGCMIHGLYTGTLFTRLFFYFDGNYYSYINGTVNLPAISHPDLPYSGTISNKRIDSLNTEVKISSSSNTFLNTSVSLNNDVIFEGAANGSSLFQIGIGSKTQLFAIGDNSLNKDILFLD